MRKLSEETELGGLFRRAAQRPTRRELSDPMRVNGSGSVEERYLSTAAADEFVVTVRPAAFYWAVRDLYVAEGVDEWEAARRALRAARVAVLLALGFDQTEIGEALGVTSRTVRADLGQARAARESGRLAAVAARPLPAVPRDPADRVSVVSRPAA